MSTFITVKIKLQEDVRWNKLNSGILVLERHFLKCQRDKNAFHRGFYLLIDQLTDYNLRRTRLINMIEKTDITKENWVEFNQNIENIENTILDIIHKEDFSQSNVDNIKNNLWFMDSLVKMRLKICRGYFIHKDIVFNQIAEEDLELNIDLEDRENYQFKMYLKNNSKAAKFKKIFIHEFNLKDLNWERDIIGKGREKFVEKVLKNKDFTVKESEKILSAYNDSLANRFGDPRCVMNDVAENTNGIENTESKSANLSSSATTATPLFTNVTQDILHSSAPSVTGVGDPLCRINNDINNTNNIKDNESKVLYTKITTHPSFHPATEEENPYMNCAMYTMHSLNNDSKSLDLEKNNIFNTIVDPPPNTTTTS